MSDSSLAGAPGTTSFNTAASYTEQNRVKRPPPPMPREREQALITYSTTSQSLLLNQFSIRSALENIDRAYMREMDFTLEQNRARVWNRAGDPNKFQNISVPIVMPQVRAALGYFTNVFLTGYPIFGVTASPENIDAATQLETIIAENAETAGWARQLLMFFLDGLKYNWHALEVCWEQRTTAEAVTNPTSPTGASTKTVLWNGNIIRRMDPYNSFFDPRPYAADLAEMGEFAGYNELFTRTQLKKYLNDLTGYINPATVERALESTYGGGVAATGWAPFAYYQPLLNPEPLMTNSMLRTFDWMAWANANAVNSNLNVSYGNVYIKTKMYCRIIPSDFGMEVPGRNTPQVWELVIINGQVVVKFERVNAAHNWLPIFAGQPLEDGLRFQTKSFATNVLPMQQVASAMMNGFVASKRRLVGDRMIYDPLRIASSDINSDSPTAKIPVRPAAYGKPLNEAVFPIPFRDEQTASLVQGAKIVTDYANMINQQNPAQQGQFVKGNKTLHEYEDVMGHGNAGNQVMAITIEEQVFQKVKQVIKFNILLYQGEAVMYNKQSRQTVKIDPVVLRRVAVQFKISDGLIPEDKLMNGDEWIAAMQAISSSQQLQQRYDLAALFTYLMKQRGADIEDFEKPPEQVQYEQALGAWQQAAAMAAQKGTDFSTPMPQPPPKPDPSTQGPSPKSVALSATQGANSPTTST